MQPTQLSAMAVVPARLRTNASSLNNAMRNVFQSFGIAMLSTVVTTQTVVHGIVLGWGVRADTMQGQTVPTLSAVLQQTDGSSSGVADLSAMSMVLGQIGQQAAVLAFGDAYRITFCRRGDRLLSGGAAAWPHPIRPVGHARWTLTRRVNGADSLRADETLVERTMEQPLVRK
jgi:hypothetical protein